MSFYKILYETVGFEVSFFIVTTSS